MNHPARRGFFRNSEWGDLVNHFTWLLSILLTAFLISLVFLRGWLVAYGLGGSAAAVLSWIAANIWWVMFIYMNIQIWAFSIRNPANLLQALLDHVSSIIAAVSGTFLYVLAFFVPLVWNLPSQEWHTIQVATFWAWADVLWGIVIPLRIALVPGERRETLRRE